MQEIRLNYTPDQHAVVMRCSQNDVGRKVRFRLYDDGVPFVLSYPMVATIQGTKPNGLGFAVLCEVNDVYNYLEVVLTKEMTESAGKFPVDIKVENRFQDEICYTSNFWMWVEKNPHPSGTNDGTGPEALSTLTELANRATAAAETAETSANAATTALAEAAQLLEEVVPENIAGTVTAWMDAHPEATTTVQDESLTYKKLIPGTLGFYTPQMFGAVADGQTDDTQAVQDALDAARNSGGVIFFPKGVYLLSTVLFRPGTNTDAALEMYAGETLLGAKDAVLKVGDASVRHIIFNHNEANTGGYDGDGNIVISGLTFDGSYDLLSGYSTPVSLSHAKDITIDNCRFINNGKNWHCIEVNSSRNVKIDNCVFTDNANSESIQIDGAGGAGNTGASDGTASQDVQISRCYFETAGFRAIGNHDTAAHTGIRIHDNVFHGGGSEDQTRLGYIFFNPQVTKVDIYNNTFHNSRNGVVLTANDPNSTIHDNRFEGVTYPFTTNNDELAYNNIVDGVMQNELFYDSGWVDITSLLNTDVFTPRGGGSFAPAVRRIRDTIYFRGEAYISTAINAWTSTRMFDALPAEFIPGTQRHFSGITTTGVQFSGWIATNGQVIIRVSDGAMMGSSSGIALANITPTPVN